MFLSEGKESGHAMAAAAAAVAHHRHTRPDALVDRACSDLLHGPDWSINLQLCDVCSTSPT